MPRRAPHQGRPIIYSSLGGPQVPAPFSGDYDDLTDPPDLGAYQVLHGWPLDAAGDPLTTMTYDPSARTVTITALVGATIDLWVLGEKITFASPHVSAAHTATAGPWFYYHDGTSFVWNQSPWDMTRESPICYAYWSTVANSGMALEERHRAERSAEWHYWAHASQGTVLLSGGVLGDYTLATDTDAAIQYSITECRIADEDIESTLAAKADGAGFTVWYRSGASGIWTWSTGETLPFLYGTYPRYNQFTGGSWTMTDISGAALGSWMTSYVLAVPALDSNHRFVIIPGQTQYSSLAAATAESITSLVLGDLPFSEAVTVAQLVFQARSVWGGTAKAELVSVTRLVGARVTITAAGAAANHNSLSGLQGGTTDEYYHLTAAQYAALGGGGGVTDHGALTGLADDDHTQYHNDTRGDARYAPIAEGVTNGDSHDHNGGDGGQIAYSTLSGLPTLGTAAATASTDYAPAAQGVTNGNSHNHAGGDGAQIAYSDLSGTPTLYNQTVEDEGTPVTQRATVNFVGAGVSVSDVGSKTTVTIAGGAVHDPVTVTDSTSINFTLTGQDVTAAAIFGTTAGTVAEGNHGHAGLVTNGDSHDHNGGDGAQIAYSTLSGLPPIQMALHYHAHGSANVTLTNQAVAQDWLAGGSRNMFLVDLTGYNFVRLQARVVTASASANSPKIYLQYRAAYSASQADWTLSPGTSAVECSLSATGMVDSGWIAMAAGAQAEVHLGCFQSGGDAGADPALGKVTAFVKV